MSWRNLGTHTTHPYSPVVTTCQTKIDTGNSNTVVWSNIPKTGPVNTNIIAQFQQEVQRRQMSPQKPHFMTPTVPITHQPLQHPTNAQHVPQQTNQPHHQQAYVTNQPIMNTLLQSNIMYPNMMQPQHPQHPQQTQPQQTPRWLTNQQTAPNAITNQMKSVPPPGFNQSAPLTSLFILPNEAPPQASPISVINNANVIAPHVKSSWDQINDRLVQQNMLANAKRPTQFVTNQTIPDRNALISNTNNNYQYQLRANTMNGQMMGCNSLTPVGGNNSGLPVNAQYMPTYNTVNGTNAAMNIGNDVQRNTGINYIQNVPSQNQIYNSGIPNSSTIPKDKGWLHPLSQMGNNNCNNCNAPLLDEDVDQPIVTTRWSPWSDDDSNSNQTENTDTMSSAKSVGNLEDCLRAMCTPECHVTEHVICDRWRKTSPDSDTDDPDLNGAYSQFRDLNVPSVIRGDLSREPSKDRVKPSKARLKRSNLVRISTLKEI